MYALVMTFAQPNVEHTTLDIFSDFFLDYYHVFYDVRQNLCTCMLFFNTFLYLKKKGNKTCVKILPNVVKNRVFGKKIEKITFFVLSPYGICYVMQVKIVIFVVSLFSFCPQMSIPSKKRFF
jgi:hypothetical protein